MRCKKTTKTVNLSEHVKEKMVGKKIGGREENGKGIVRKTRVKVTSRFIEPLIPLVYNPNCEDILSESSIRPQLSNHEVMAPQMHWLPEGEELSCSNKGKPRRI